MRKRLLITGAAGGFGRSCARLLGATHDLILTDVRAEPLERLAVELRDEGYVVVDSHAGELDDEGLLARLRASLGGEAFVLVHTAGLSPALADWNAIIRTNLVATERLLRMLEANLPSGSVVALIASASGYRIERQPHLATLLADPLAPDFVDRIGHALRDLATRLPMDLRALAYTLSKHMVHRFCEQRAQSWGKAGARIFSVSPGLTLTEMGRREMATARTAGVNKPPLGRFGTPMDVAAAIGFLIGDEASFITGCDLRIDGGALWQTGRSEP